MANKLPVVVGLTHHHAFPLAHASVAILERFATIMAKDKPVKCCPECLSVDIEGPDDEGLFDCGNCAIWFDPTHLNNAACYGEAK